MSFGGFEHNSVLEALKASILSMLKRKTTLTCFPSFYLSHLFWHDSENWNDKLCHCSQHSISSTDDEIAKVCIKNSLTTVYPRKTNSNHVQVLNFYPYPSDVPVYWNTFPPFKVNKRKKIHNSQTVLSVHYLCTLTMGHGKLQAFPSISIDTLKSMGKHPISNESLSLLVRYYQYCVPILGLWCMKRDCYTFVIGQV